MTTFNRRTRHAVLTAHIAVPVRAMGEDDPDATHTKRGVFNRADDAPMARREDRAEAWRVRRP